MTAMTIDRDTPRQVGDPIPMLFQVGVAANAVGFAGGIACVNAAGYITNGSTSPALRAIGRTRADFSNIGGANNAFLVTIDCGAFAFNNSTGSDQINQANLFQPVYLVDDQTVALTDGGGQRPIAGIFTGFDTVTLQPYVLMMPPSAPAASTASVIKVARAVVTSLAAYAGSGTGTLTGSANGAFGTQDGVSTLIVGDAVFIPPGTTNLVAASDAGPYVIQSLGAAGAKYVLVRPSWYQTGMTVPLAYAIDIGGEGALFGGNVFRSMAVKGQVVDTNDAAFYPRLFKKTVTLVGGTYTIGHGGGSEPLSLFSASLSSVQITQNTVGGTIGTGRMAAPSASRTIGYAGTASVVINSLSSTGTLVATDTSTVDVLIANW